MKVSAISEPLVTVIVVPRERFTLTQETLETLYNCTEIPFNLIYIDGNSPPAVKRYLQEQSQEKGFQLIRTDYYLYPNLARNIGLRHVKTKYLVFIDNDVIVTPGWLKALVACAEENQATVVGPLTGIGSLEQGIIHNAGGVVYISERSDGQSIKRYAHEKMYYHNRKVADVRDQLKPVQCTLAEFHCMLVRTELFETLGSLDEKLLNTREHLDFCLTLEQLGEKVYCEPKSYVSYVPGPNFIWSDLHFYMLRWSNAWELASLKHFSQKWNLSTDNDFFEKRYKHLGWRREKGIIRPLAQKIAPGRLGHWAIKVLRKIDSVLNPILTSMHARAEQQRQRRDHQQPA